MLNASFAITGPAATPYRLAAPHITCSRERRSCWGAVLTWRAHRHSDRLFLFLMLTTLIWALWGSGLGGRALLPRLNILLLLGLALIVGLVVLLNHERITAGTASA